MSVELIQMAEETFGGDSQTWSDDGQRDLSHHVEALVWTTRPTSQEYMRGGLVESKYAEQSSSEQPKLQFPHRVHNTTVHNPCPSFRLPSIGSQLLWPQ